MKKTIHCAACLLLAASLLTGCAAKPIRSSDAALPGTTSGSNAAERAAYEGAHVIVLSDTAATLDREAVEAFDYVWHADPSAAHDEVKDCPAEYFTGTPPVTDAAVYIAHDIAYYPELPESGFEQAVYDGEREWVCRYTAKGYEDYLFATLPVFGASIPKQMMHTPEEAYANPVLHIVQAGTYLLEGDWHGQILVDLGEDAFADETQKVTLVLRCADVECTVAPALVFRNVYECDNAWEERGEYTEIVDTSDAGAVLVIADGTVNSLSGTNVYRMLKAKYKSEETAGALPVQKKARKTDGALYSYVSMNIEGEEKNSGVLNVTSGFEGVDSELHLSFNGGRVNIASQDDGVNTNEDGVSVTAFNGGSVHILAGLGSEGDGVDSNGFLVVNGGSVIALANPASDSGLDSDCGSYINGGWVFAAGSAMDWPESDSKQVTMNLQFAGMQSADEAVIVTDQEGMVLFAYDPDKDETAASRNRSYQGAILSCPTLKVGSGCFVYVGGDVTGSETNGLYDPATVTDFAGAVRQKYTGNEVGMVGMGGMGGPGGVPGGMRQESLDLSRGFRVTDGEGNVLFTYDPAVDQLPEVRVEDLEGNELFSFDPEQGMPNGMGGFGGQRPEASGALNAPQPPMQSGGAPEGGEANVFLLSEPVNAFSGVSDE